MAAAAAMDFLFLGHTSIRVTRHNINWTKDQTKVNHVAAAAALLLLLLLLPLHCFVGFVVICNARLLRFSAYLMRGNDDDDE
jgi:succinate dehydrogenase hydrophobic anchor subunit